MSRFLALVAVLVVLTVVFGPTAAAEPSPPTVPITVENTVTPVEQPPVAERHLASTGADVISLVWTGFALIACGALVIALSRRLGGA